MVGKTQELLADYVKYEGSDWAVCKLCKPPQRLSRKDGSNSNIVNHLRSRHPTAHAKFEEKKRKATLPPADAPSVKKFFSASAPSQTPKSNTPEVEVAEGSVSSQQRQATLEETSDKSYANGCGKTKVDRALVKLIVGANLPLSLVDHPAFIEFVGILRPSYKVPSRRTVTERLDSLCSDVEEKIKEELRNADSVSLTSDGWTAKNCKLSLLSMTSHFINENSEPVQRCTAVIPLRESHESEKMAPLFDKALEFYALPTSKIHALVRDSGSNMKAMCRILNLESIDCFAHKVQNAVKDGLAFLPSLPALLAKLKKIVRKLRKSSVELRRFDDLLDENDLPPLVLKKDCDTRWNSCFLMMNRFLHLRPAVEQLIATSEVLPIITTHEWTLMQNVVELLRPIYDATLALQSRQTCASAILPLYFAIQQKPLPGQELAKMHRAIITGLDTRMNGWIDDHLLVLATVLDPLLKLSRFQKTHHAEIQTMLETKAIAKSTELSGAISPAASSDNGAEEDDLLMKVLGSVEGGSNAAPNSNPDAIAKAKVEVAEYIKERPTKQNPYAYWKSPENAARFPLLRSMAYAYLSAPATSTESERMFSGAGLIYSIHRQSMSDNTLQKLLFLHMNVDLI